VTFRPTGLDGLTLLDSLVHRDERGESRKVVTRALLEEAGLDPHIEEVLCTTNQVAGTVRGLHFQQAPAAESKTLWVTRGALFDVVVDLRPDRPSHGQVFRTTLRADDGVALHVPSGFAHGYQTLSDDTRLTYLISAAYSPGDARTLAWDDPELAIDWPLAVTRISDNDRAGTPWSDLR
jgi:dTDP-4-dehydrorhamnose 3,5-epimerase